MITELKHSNDNDVIIEFDFKLHEGPLLLKTHGLSVKLCQMMQRSISTECTECGEQHMRILLPPEYSGKFTDRLEFEDLQYLAH